MVGGDGSGEELQGKTRRKGRNPSRDGGKEEQGKKHSSKGTFSPLFLSNATTILVTATKNLHHPTSALSLRKPTTNFTEIPVGLRVRGTGCIFDTVIWKLNLALSKQARQGQGHTPGGICRSSALPWCSSMPAFGTPAQFTCAFQCNLKQKPCAASHPTTFK